MQGSTFLAQRGAVRVCPPHQILPFRRFSITTGQPSKSPPATLPPPRICWPASARDHQHKPHRDLDMGGYWCLPCPKTCSLVLGLLLGACGRFLTIPNLCDSLALRRRNLCPPPCLVPRRATSISNFHPSGTSAYRVTMAGFCNTTRGTCNNSLASKRCAPPASTREFAHMCMSLGAVAYMPLVGSTALNFMETSGNFCIANAYCESSCPRIDLFAQTIL